MLENYRSITKLLGKSSLKVQLARDKGINWWNRICTVRRGLLAKAVSETGIRKNITTKSRVNRRGQVKDMQMVRDWAYLEARFLGLSKMFVF